MGNESREIRIVLNGKRLILSGILAGILFFAAVAGTIVLANVMKTNPAMAENFQEAAFKPITSGTWYFAEGYTGPGFEEWLLIFNPPANVGGYGDHIICAVYFYNNAGLLTQKWIDIPSGQRYSLNVNAFLKDTKNYSGDVSIVVSGGDSHDKPIICERALYFQYGADNWTGGSQTLGYTQN